MDFTVEGKKFRALSVGAEVLGTTPQATRQAVVVSLNDAAGTALRLPRGEKGWQSAALRLENGVEVLLPLPQDVTVDTGESLVLGCLGPVAAAREGTLGDKAPLEVYAVRSTNAASAGGESAALGYFFVDAATLMKRCGLARATQYAVEKYPLKKVCKVSAIIFIVGLVCFSFLMHLFTESMDELVSRLPEALLMSAKFGGVSALVVAVGGGLFVKSSNDYNSKKQYENYARQFEQAMVEVLVSPAA